MSARVRIEAALHELERTRDTMATGTANDFDWQTRTFVSNQGYVVNKHSGMRLCRGVKPPRQRQEQGEVFFAAEGEANDNES